MEFLTPKDVFAYYPNPDKQLLIKMYQEKIAQKLSEGEL
jgi:hypothetical protein